MEAFKMATSARLRLPSVCPVCLRPLASTPLLLCPLGLTIYPPASNSGLSLFVFTAPLLLSTLYSLHVYISFLWQALAAQSPPIFVLWWTLPALFFFLFPSQHFIILISLPNSSFILLDLFCFLSPRFPLPRISNSKDWELKEMEDQEARWKRKPRERLKMESVGVNWTVVSPA